MSQWSWAAASLGPAKTDIRARQALARLEYLTAETRHVETVWTSKCLPMGTCHFRSLSVSVPCIHLTRVRSPPRWVGVFSTVVGGFGPLDPPPLGGGLRKYVKPVKVGGMEVDRGTPSGLE